MILLWVDLGSIGMPGIDTQRNYLYHLVDDVRLFTGCWVPETEKTATPNVRTLPKPLFVSYLLKQSI